MKSLNLRRWPLTLKLPIILATFIIITAVAITMTSVQRERASFRSELQTQAEVVLATLENAIANPLYTLDIDFLESTMEVFHDSESGVLARIYDPDGRLIADSELECYRLSKSAFQDIVQSRPDLVDDISRTLASRLGALERARQQLGEEAAASASSHSDLSDRIRRFFGMTLR